MRSKTLPQAEFSSAEEVKLGRVPKARSALGAQVRVPISELKSWLEEKIFF